jgi:hypothetical protein
MELHSVAPVPLALWGRQAEVVGHNPSPHTIRRLQWVPET